MAEAQQKCEPTLGQETEQAASASLERRGVLARLIAAWLFGLLCAFTCLFVAQMVDVICAQLYTLWEGPVTEFLFYLLPIAVLVCSLVLVVLPLWLGRIRMAGLALNGEDFALRECFYYFTSLARHWRAVRVGLSALLMAAVPASFCALACFGSYQIFDLVRSSLHANLLAVIAAQLILLALGIFALLMLLSGRFLLFAALAVGNEELSLSRCLSLALSAGRVTDVFRTVCRWLWYLFLSLCTVGVLYVLRYAHLITLSYLRLAQTLCPKGEQ